MMSDRIQGFVVTFDENVHEDYMRRVQDSILCFAGVGSVDPIVADVQSHIAKEQVRREYLRKILEVLK